MTEFLLALLFTFVILLVIFYVAYKLLLPEKKIINTKNLAIIFAQAVVIALLLSVI
ncbi:hypothetical protein [Planococcus halocryophilus]|uniref:hypothetical protein n=1 Tax=Planococcus halocryophilus TaxID=1215089 RepID=UPI001F114A88|nr:hypothetical protein [Planococcus halocryophilus]MCH4827967.1 hypothetical protein [Planococcus halocryophilus]